MVDAADEEPPIVSSRSKLSPKSARQPRSARRHLQFEESVPTWPDPNKYHHRSLLCLTLQNPFRRAIIAAVERPIWDRTVLFVITFNACALLSHDPYDVPELLPSSPRRNVLRILSQVLALISREDFI